MENDFIVSIKGTTLTIELGKELTTANSPALTQELSKYRGQDINKVVFDAIFFVNQRIGHNPEIVFVNCAKEIYESLEFVGLTKTITFEENKSKLILRQKKVLEDYAANNDVVCYQMKLGQED